jgi:hypothetical protein
MKVWTIIIGVSMLAMSGCSDGKKSEGDSRFAPIYKAKACEVDKDCLKGFICKELTCQKGKRSAADLEKIRKAKIESEKKAEAARNRLKPGEGRLRIRICPFFKNTPNASASLFAVHQKTKKKHWLALHNKAPENARQSMFTFPSLPLGTYDVNLKMGIRVRGQHDLTDMNCHPKARPCRGGTIREVDVMLPENEPPAEKKEDGTDMPPPCDFVAE